MSSATWPSVPTSGIRTSVSSSRGSTIAIPSARISATRSVRSEIRFVSAERCEVRYASSASDSSS